MFQVDEYLSDLVRMLRAAYGDRLRYVGLQGSYLRGEATEASDLDVMVVISCLTVQDLRTYQDVIRSLPDFEKSCGFLCGEEELRHWNRLEIGHVLHTTKDYVGTLSDLVPAYSREDVCEFVRYSLDAFYHELCHRYIHQSRERNREAIGLTSRSVFFILQNLWYHESGTFLTTKHELLAVLTGTDRAVLECSMALSRGEPFDLDAVFSLLFSWCQQTMQRMG